ncbi:glycosyltransferase family protein [Thiorhodovibrio frisius]|uniref:Glycosyltransferase n=1 Tax=Thiorhodovibrio frisius TaxID=631362 RepID=H8Z1V5_9GAMM|nr:hypothetical protein [Thiorhodovibrio frisius]EIC22583.1 hypothetical protein Thi970DRAFT_02855 [Thiorhodovibrio frisius]WPL20024.1 hypothetical protein Thiofri_00075 [Thiorhodovibrio frisius]
MFVHLIEERPNPSTDYFVRPALPADGRPIQCHQFGQPLPDPTDLIGATVVLVRYVPPAWARLIERHRARLGELIYFMDDDLFDLAAAKGTPWRYRLKLARLATWRQHWLQRHKARLWVSTPYLQAKYAHWNPERLLPAPLPAPDSAVGGNIRVFYHGSASHQAEIDWLYPVMQTALDAEPRLSFEIIGTAKVNRRYRRLPRTTVVHPMSWPTYQCFLATPGRHIGLAPLLDNPFNRARSCTKFFDITRAGAIGIYAAGSVCDELIQSNQDGLLIPMIAERWVDAILGLAQRS